MARRVYLLLLILTRAVHAQQSSASRENLAGQQLIEQKRFAEAKQAFKRAIALQPGYPDALENLAVLDLMTRSEGEAQRAARDLLRVDPENYNGRLTLAITLLYEGKAADSLRHFGALKAASDRDPLVLAGLIECYNRLGRSGEAVRVRRELESVSIDPRDALLSVQVFQRAPLHRYVLAWLEQANKAAPSFLPLYTALGNELLEHGEITKALDCLRRAAAMKPSDPALLLALYRAEMKAGNRSEALKYLYQAKDTVQGDMAAVIEYSVICIRNRMFLDSRLALDAALRSAPGNARLHYLLGASLFGLDELPAAKMEFERALKIEPDSPDNWIAHGVTELSQGGPEAALPDFRHALTLDNTSAAAYFYIGQCLRRSGEPDAARQALRNAIRLAPSDARPYAELGAILLSEGRSAEAEREIRQAVSLDNNIASAHYQLGLLLRKKGDAAAASTELHLAKDLREQEANSAVIRMVGSVEQ